MDRKVEAGPPAVAEGVVRLLMPPASREHVVGDLAERYVSPGRYFVDVLQTLPFVLASRIRRTTNVGLLAFLLFYMWFAAFHGNKHSSFLIAAIPTLAAAFGFKLRDVYRGVDVRSMRAAAVDMVVAAVCVLATQAALALFAPALLLPRDVLYGSFPISFAVLFFVRWRLASLSCPRWCRSS
jgi:hypothetical protein